MADSSLPLVCGERGAQSLSSKPASRANRHALSCLVLLRPETVTRHDMLSVRHSSGTPPSLVKVEGRQERRSSSVRLLTGMNRCFLE